MRYVANLFLDFLRMPRIQLRPRTETAIDWFRCLPFIVLHILCIGVIWVGVSWAAVIGMLVTYSLRMFVITGFYHRYFSHRAFKTSRWFQFVMAFIGCSSGQRGPLWWAAHHRHHHNHSDEQDDIHSPHQMSFLRSHMGWFMTRKGFERQDEFIQDWKRYPELLWMERFDMVPAVVLGVVVLGVGYYLGQYHPELGTNGMQMLMWGFFVSTILVYHATYTINSLAHQFGTQRFKTDDHSRNNRWLAMITFGEGWHNNHHHYPSAARQGFYWWEIDLTYYGLKVLSWVGLIWGVREVPARVLAEGRAGVVDAQEQVHVQKGGE